MRKVLISMVILTTMAFGLVIAATTLFEPLVSYDVGDNPARVCQADFDGDGDIDLAVTRCNFDLLPDLDPNAGVVILKNNGDGTYAQGVYCPAGEQTFGICSADFDDDEDIDLAVIDHDGGTVSILTNDGTGSFALSSSCATGRTACRSICAADLDGDGDSDLATVSWTSNTLSILVNDGTGAFVLDTYHTVGDGLNSACLSDLDGDGDIDIAAADMWSNTTSVFLNDGGVFTLAAAYTSGSGAYHICASDLDNDGDDDLALALQEMDMVAVLKNNGDATFAEPDYYSVLLLPLMLCAVDFDGDGYKDLAVTCHTFDSVSVLGNNGDGTFALHSKYGTGTFPLCVGGGDYDGDGDNDLAVVNHWSDDVAILTNNTISTNAGENGNHGELPGQVQVRQNYPNPFNPTTSIEFALASRAHVSLAIYNVAGQKIRQLADREYAAGSHVLTWDGRDEDGQSVATGVYFYRLQAGNVVESKKMVLVK